MEHQSELIMYTLVAAPCVIGENFVKLLHIYQRPFAVLVNNSVEKQRMKQLGAKHIIEVDTVHHEAWEVPELPIGDVYLFEDSLTLCCRYLQMVRSWTTGNIVVVKTNPTPRLIYKALGADHVVHTNKDQVSFLLRSERPVG
ncbi:hypothetical protein [Paenibacillus sp. FJAT-26967]|uniref:hypothetical protein n=1 Tax=Paenibacillus sp. FJAT-26967 TaxID=1729690 RepID=UPI0008394BCD|nr:hypothetical protein [Paenibacillus sp. FJAT-26967]